MFIQSKSGFRNIGKILYKKVALFDLIFHIHPCFENDTKLKINTHNLERSLKECCAGTFEILKFFTDTLLKVIKEG